MSSPSWRGSSRVDIGGGLYRVGEYPKLDGCVIGVFDEGKDTLRWDVEIQKIQFCIYNGKRHVVPSLRLSTHVLQRLTKITLLPYTTDPKMLMTSGGSC